MWQELSPSCSLRLLHESDAHELHALILANRDHLSPWMDWAAHQTLQDTRDFIHNVRQQLVHNDGFQLAIAHERQLIGVVGFHSIDWTNRATSIGYWLAHAQQGNGTMTQAVRTLVDHAFHVWQLHRVEVRIAPQNSRSRAVAQRLGFHQEAVLREAELIGDRYLDSVVYSMLAGEWAHRE
jgi:ribosomal-protein-serine acetyltransferase